MIFTPQVMLRYSRRRRHYTPPSWAAVVQKAAIVYLAVGFVSSISIWPVQWLPIRTNLQNGFLCTPLDYDLTSTMILYGLYFPVLVGLPVTFVLLVAYDVFCGSRLLPPQGKRRVLTIYFFRMAFIFLFMWIPNSFVTYFFPRTPLTVKWIVIVWSHFQGFVTAATSLLKPDILQAVRDLLGCGRCCRESSSSSYCCGGGCGGAGFFGDGGSSTFVSGDLMRSNFTTNEDVSSSSLRGKQSSRWVIWDQGDNATRMVNGRRKGPTTTSLPTKNIPGKCAFWFLTWAVAAGNPAS
jgi:hypothetical protein